MFSPKTEESRYGVLSSQAGEHEHEYVEDNFSDTTETSSTLYASKSASPSQHQSIYHEDWLNAKRARARRQQTFTTWLRWSIIVLLQSIIILLLISTSEKGAKTGESQSELRGKVIETGDDINGLFKTCKCILTSFRWEWHPSENVRANQEHCL